MNDADHIAALKDELRRLREVEVSELKKELTEGKQEIARLRRGLYGENGIYRGLSGEFEKLRDNDLRVLRSDVEEIKDACEELAQSDKQRQKREALWSRWAFVLVPIILGSSLMAIITLVTLILQTYAFQA